MDGTLQLANDLVRWTQMWSFWGKILYGPYLLGASGVLLNMSFCKIQFHGVFRPFVKRSLVDRCLETSIILWIPTIILEIFVQTLVQFGKISIWCRVFMSQFISEIKFDYNHQIKKSCKKYNVEVCSVILSCSPIGFTNSEYSTFMTFLICTVFPRIISSLE